MFVIADAHTDVFYLDASDVIKVAYKAIESRDTIMVDYVNGKAVEVFPKDIEDRVHKRYYNPGYPQFHLFTTKESVIPFLESCSYLKSLYSYMKEDEAMIVDYKNNISFCFPSEAMPKRFHQLKVIYAIRKKYRLSDRAIERMFPEIDNLDLQSVFQGYYSARKNIGFVYRRFIRQYKI